MPEITINVTDTHIKCAALVPHCTIWVYTEPKIHGLEAENWNIWGVAHLPSGDNYEIGIPPRIRWDNVPLADLPPFGTPIEVDVYSHWGGKTIHSDLTITDWRQQVL